MHLPFFIFIFALVAIVGSSHPASAFTELQCYTFKGCGGGRSSSSSSNPSYGNEIRINPSAVPTEKGVGLEGILFKNEVDFAFAQGMGRVGAALSPSNSEETFFGPIGIELSEQLLLRKQKEKKFPNQKVTLASAANLIKRKGSGIKSYALQLGFMGRYNRMTKNISPGGGISGLVGPFTFGASLYNDESQLDMSLLGSEDRPVVDYKVQAYNGGISLGSLLVDYSVLRLEAPDTQELATVRLVTASLLIKKVILTASKRTEDSHRPDYNYATKQLEEKKIKEEIFGGLQINATNNLMVGVLYNYYLLHEFSMTATLFF